MTGTVAGWEEEVDLNVDLNRDHLALKDSAKCTTTLISQLGN